MNDDWQNRAAAPKPGQVLCRLDEITDGQAKGFVFREHNRLFRMMVYRRGDAVWGYVDECPHRFTPLAWDEDLYLNMHGTAFLCATHGAQFELESGYCFLGPCKGQSLIKIPLEMKQDQICIQSPEEL